MGYGSNGSKRLKLRRSFNGSIKTGHFAKQYYESVKVYPGRQQANRCDRLSRFGICGHLPTSLISEWFYKSEFLPACSD